MNEASPTWPIIVPASSPWKPLALTFRSLGGGRRGLPRHSCSTQHPRPPGNPAVLIYQNSGVYFSAGVHKLATKLQTMVQPILSTLERGFRAVAPEMKVLRGICLTASGWNGVINFRTLGTNATVHVADVIQTRDVFVFVGEKHYEMPWREIKARGAITVYYQTENPNTRYYFCADPLLAGDGKRSAPAGLDEVWTFTRKGPDSCGNASRRPHVPWGSASGEHPAWRYVPPGFASAVANCEIRDVLNATRTLTFLGKVDASMEAACRSYCWTYLNQRDPLFRTNRSILRKMNDVWGPEEFEQLFRNNAIFLNLHKMCRRPQGSFCTYRDDPNVNSVLAPQGNAVRLSQILNARRLTLSERSYWRDEQEYEGLVRFAPLEKIGDEFVRAQRELRALGPDGTNAFFETQSRIFAKRFDPVNIFLRAEIHTLWT